MQHLPTVQQEDCQHFYYLLCINTSAHIKQLSFNRCKKVPVNPFPYTSRLLASALIGHSRKKATRYPAAVPFNSRYYGHFRWLQITAIHRAAQIYCKDEPKWPAWKCAVEALQLKFQLHVRRGAMFVKVMYGSFNSVFVFVP